LLVGEVKKLVEFDTSVLVLPEGPLPLHLSGLVGVGEACVSLGEQCVSTFSGIGSRREDIWHWPVSYRPSSVGPFRASPCLSFH
jgi:hypothetical protein